MRGGQGHQSMIETRGARLEVTARRGTDDYRAAHRHSGIVRALRWVLPAVVVLAGGAFAATLYMSPATTSTASLGKIDLDTNSLVMDAPKVSGFTNSKRAYELSAEKATQSLQNPKVVTLEKIDATLGLDGTDKATVSAKAGVYDSDAETLKLKDGIRIETSMGYQANLKEAEVNLRTNAMQSSEPVEIKLIDGMIHGNTVEISEGGKRIVFSNGVSMTMGGSQTGAERPAQ